MRFSSWFDIVAPPVRKAASIALGLAITAGIAGGLFWGYVGSTMHEPRSIAMPLGGVSGLFGGLFVGGMFALLILSLGYVYADARRRNMPAVAWTLVAFFVPNLLGFLLYFVLRKPIASPCPQCGQPFAMDQRFCSWCGYQRPLAAVAITPPSGSPALR